MALFRSCPCALALPWSLGYRRRLRYRLTYHSVKKHSARKGPVRTDEQPLFLVDRLSPPDAMGPGLSAALASRHAGGERRAKGGCAAARFHGAAFQLSRGRRRRRARRTRAAARSEENTSELQSIMRNSYAVLCFKKKTQT